LVNPSAGSIFRVNVNSSISGVNSGWPTIKSSAIIPSARPFEIPVSTPQLVYDSLYAGGIIESKSGFPPFTWTGVSTVLAKRFNVGNNRTNFVMSSIPLEQFNGNANADSLFKKIFVDELKF
jgi:hypothetical protein